MVNLTKIQQEAHVWRLENFDHDTITTMHQLLGVVEELGELSHAVLKRDQQIRGDSTQHNAEIEDAVGDLTIFLLGVCSCEGLNFEDVVRKTWAEVSKRNWKSSPADGIVDERAVGGAGA